MVAFNGACNYVSAVAWKERTFDKRRLQRLVYYPIRAEFGLPAQLAIRAIAKVADTYRVSKATLATFHPMGAATYDSRILSLKNLSTVSLTTLQGRIKVGLNVGGYQTNRLAGAVLGETDLLWNPEKRRFSFAFSVKQETLPPSEPTEFLGVDLGIKNIAVDSDGNRYAGGKLRRYRKKSRRLRGRLQKLGTRGSRRLIAKRGKKEHRHASHVNHIISKKLVACAQGTGRGIAVEDLTGINGRTTVRREQRAEHRGWAFHQLRTFLAYKCADAGIPCVPVNAAYSSRTCPKCGCVDQRNRPTQSLFLCIRCGETGLADLFAAQEIALRGCFVSQPNCPAGQPAQTRVAFQQGKVSPSRVANAHTL